MRIVFQLLTRVSAVGRGIVLTVGVLAFAFGPMVGSALACVTGDSAPRPMPACAAGSACGNCCAVNCASQADGPLTASVPPATFDFSRLLPPVAAIVLPRWEMVTPGEAAAVAAQSRRQTATSLEAALRPLDRSGVLLI